MSPPSKSDASSPRLKLVIRRLPPTIPEQVFWNSISTWVNKESCSWKRWVAGNKVDDTHLHQIFSRAYVLMSTPERLSEFAMAFDGHVFRSKDGIEFRAVVEYAPSQKIPNSRKVRVDARQGQIDSDPDYLSFMKSLEEPIVKMEPTLTSEPISKSTALLDHLRDLRALKKSKSSSPSANSPIIYSSGPVPANNNSRNGKKENGKEGKSSGLGKNGDGKNGANVGGGGGGGGSRNQGQGNTTGGKTNSSTGGGKQAQTQSQIGNNNRSAGTGNNSTHKSNNRQQPQAAGNSNKPGVLPSTTAANAPNHKPVIQIMKRVNPIATPAAGPSQTPHTSQPANTNTNTNSNRPPRSAVTPNQNQNQNQNQSKQVQRPKISPTGIQGGRNLLSVALNASTAQAGASGTGTGSGNRGAGKQVMEGDGAGTGNGDGERQRARTRGRKKPKGENVAGGTGNVNAGPANVGSGGVGRIDD